jgi:hypothetical protein
LGVNILRIERSWEFTVDSGYEMTVVVVLLKRKDSEKGSKRKLPYHKTSGKTKK